MTEYHRLGGLKQKTLICHSSGGWEVPDKGASRVGFIVRILLMTYRSPPSISLCAYMTHSLRACAKTELSGAPSYKGTDPIMRLHLHDLI